MNGLPLGKRDMQFQIDNVRPATKRIKQASVIQSQMVAIFLEHVGDACRFKYYGVCFAIFGYEPVNESFGNVRVVKDKRNQNGIKMFEKPGYILDTYVFQLALC